MANHNPGIVVIASLATGPLFVIGLSAGMSIFNGDPAVATGDSGQIATSLLSALLLIPVSSIAGALLAVLPILAGNWLMTELARGNEALRFPPVWAIVGGAIAGTPAFLAWEGSPIDVALAAGFACAGAGSALICRAGAHWND